MTRRRRLATALAAVVALFVAAVLAAPASASWRFETLDGATNGPNGRTTNVVGAFNATVVWSDQPHVFYFDDTGGDLRHAWWNGTTWRFESLDGNCPTTTCANGSTNRRVGAHVEATVWAGTPHVWYHDLDGGDLRHAWWTGSQWRFETLDGDSAAGGRTIRNVGRHNAAAVWNGEPHVFYSDNEDNDLRHAWWNGVRWNYEILDGAGGTDGRTTNVVGRYNAVTVWNNQPHAFYYDDTAEDLRHGWWTGTRWQFETLDGNCATEPCANGNTNRNVGQDNAVTVWAGTPHVWHWDETAGDLRHSWWTGTQWRHETLDGDSATGGRVNTNVGAYNAVTVWGGTPHVWYADLFNAALRHAWWTGTAWNYETLDGLIACPTSSCPNGSSNFNTGVWNAVTVWNSQPHVWYQSSSIGDLRHAWYG